MLGIFFFKSEKVQVVYVLEMEGERTLVSFGVTKWALDMGSSAQGIVTYIQSHQNFLGFPDRGIHC